MLSLPLLLLLAACSRQPAPQPPPPVRFVLAKPVQGNLPHHRAEYVALIRGDVETDLSLKVSGVLQLIGRDGGTNDWQEGATFRQGDVLARLTQADFETAVRLVQARGDLNSFLFERATRLGEAMSEQEREIVKSNKRVADAELEKAQQALRDSVLRAPYDGTILARLANAGETCAAGRTVLRIADLRRMSVELGVPERVVNEVRPGQTLDITVPALRERPFAGTVSEVGVAARENVRLFKVIIKVDNPEGPLRSGMTASVALDAAEVYPAAAVLVPLSALITPARAGDPRQLAVFVIDATNQLEERLVKTDDLVRSSVIVTDGLRAGEKVVLSADSSLHAGTRVDPRHSEADAAFP